MEFPNLAKMAKDYLTIPCIFKFINLKIKIKIILIKILF